MMFSIPYITDFIPYDSIVAQRHKRCRPLSRKKKPAGAYQHKKKSVWMAKRSRRRNRKK